MTQRNVAVLVGSLRKESLSRKAARTLARMAAPSLKLEIVEIGELPLYNEDLEGDVPAPWAAFRARIRAADALLFVTPEYNRSVPGLLKNAVDVGSRPWGQSVWTGKPAGVVSVSPGPYGAFGANHHIRQSFVFLDVPAMLQPEAYIANAGTLFDVDGKLMDERARQVFESYLDAFGRWIDRHAR